MYIASRHTKWRFSYFFSRWSIRPKKCVQFINPIHYWMQRQSGDSKGSVLTSKMRHGQACIKCQENITELEGDHGWWNCKGIIRYELLLSILPLNSDLSTNWTNWSRRSIKCSQKWPIGKVLCSIKIMLSGTHLSMRQKVRVLSSEILPHPSSIAELFKSHQNEKTFRQNTILLI